MSSPLIVEVTRGHEVESRHQVDAVVVDQAGRVVAGWGDTDRMVLPRSASKPLQALPLITTGAADAFDLSQIELALSCASHNGEPDHTNQVEAWLARLGLPEETLECGAQRPGYQPAADDLIRSGIEPGHRHNNCSGKHSGFLTVCRHLGLDPAGYINPDHPLQSDQVTAALEDLCMIDLAAQTPGIDGCGIPVWAIPITALARGWARLAQRGAGRRLLDAMIANPFYVAGTGRTCTQIMREARGATAVKTGAEGVFCASMGDEGLGVALKVRDGASRASGPAIEFVLDRYGTYDAPASRPVTNWAGTEVGEIRVLT
ncbi:MAG: asparaginase [Actinomycetia bacterium]|nr:asparaginase [Actinomycetes bacterium]